jgi:hypothetical protein
MSLWRWVKLLGKRSQDLQCQVQKEFMLSGLPWQKLSTVPEKAMSPSSCRAKSANKQEQLNGLFLLIEISKVFLGSVAVALEQLHAHFLKNIESRQLILTGRKIDGPTQHSMGRLF